MKIGLWLQDHNNDNEKRFDEITELVRNSDIDIFVFPENSYTPFSHLIAAVDVFSDEANDFFEAAQSYAEQLGKPVVFSDQDMFGTTFSWYVNPFAEEDETFDKAYIKHTATRYSAFDIENYIEDIFNSNFEPIIYKGKKIGLTICYDCNHALFSRCYGVNGIDIIINSTGGDIVRDKWYRYNQTRAIENNCFNIITMGYSGDKKNPNSYVFGFDPDGNAMSFENLTSPQTSEANIVDSVYIYDIDDYYPLPKVASSEPTVNKLVDLKVPADDLASVLDKSEKIAEKLYLRKHRGNSIVYCVVDENDILDPAKVCALLYNDALKGYSNKKYIILNRWEHLDYETLASRIEPVLRVRSMENYCAVLLDSNIGIRCFQCGKNRTSQEVQETGGSFGIDLGRTGGPESIWRNSPGMMKANWRKSYEWIISRLK